MNAQPVSRVIGLVVAADPNRRGCAREGRQLGELVLPRQIGKSGANSGMSPDWPTLSSCLGACIPWRPEQRTPFGRTVLVFGMFPGAIEIEKGGSAWEIQTQLLRLGLCSNSERVVLREDELSRTSESCLIQRFPFQSGPRRYPMAFAYSPTSDWNLRHSQLAETIRLACTCCTASGQICSEQAAARLRLQRLPESAEGQVAGSAENLSGPAWPPCLGVGGCQRGRAQPPKLPYLQRMELTPSPRRAGGKLGLESDGDMATAWETWAVWLW